MIINLLIIFSKGLQLKQNIYKVHKKIETGIRSRLGIHLLNYLNDFNQCNLYSQSNIISSAVP